VNLAHTMGDFKVGTLNTGVNTNFEITHCMSCHENDTRNIRVRCASCSLRICLHLMQMLRATWDTAIRECKSLCFKKPRRA
jgi:hypothetical protein